MKQVLMPSGSCPSVFPRVSISLLETTQDPLSHIGIWGTAFSPFTSSDEREEEEEL